MELDYLLFKLNLYLSFVFPALEGLNGIAEFVWKNKVLYIFFNHILF